MRDKFPDKMIVGGAWAAFNDSKASWGLSRRIGARCGQTFNATFNFWRTEFPADDPIPFVMIETWNDYEEGTAIERGIPSCSSAPQTNSLDVVAAISQRDKLSSRGKSARQTLLSAVTRELRVGGTPATKNPVSQPHSETCRTFGCAQKALHLSGWGALRS